MTKAELIAEIATKTGIDKNEVSNIVEALMKSMKDNMSAGNDIFLRGFGTFHLKKRAKKIGQLISEGKSIVIPAHFIPAFKACREFKDEVWEKVK